MEMHRLVEFILLMRPSQDRHLIPIKISSLHQKQREERHPHVLWKKPSTTRPPSPRRSLYTSQVKKTRPSQPLEEPNLLVLFYFVNAPLENGKNGDDESKRATDEDVKG